MSQKTIKGAIIDEENNPVIGALIYPNDVANGTITDLAGEFSIQIPDSVNEFIFIINQVCPIKDVHCINLDMFEVIREKITIENCDSVNLKFIRTQNTLHNFPEPTKSRILNNDRYNYVLKYNLLGKLRHVYLNTQGKKDELQYVWDIEYHKDYIRIDNYIWQMDRTTTSEKKFFISKIDFTYDNNGAIRGKAVHVDYGNHFNQSYERYYYQNNRIIKVFSFEGIRNNFYINPRSFEYQKDMFVVIIQNEILRRKLYRKIKHKYFNTDFKLLEIKE